MSFREIFDPVVKSYFKTNSTGGGGASAGNSEVVVWHKTGNEPYIDGDGRLYKISDFYIKNKTEGSAVRYALLPMSQWAADSSSISYRLEAEPLMWLDECLASAGMILTSSSGNTADIIGIDVPKGIYIPQDIYAIYDDAAMILWFNPDEVELV